VSRCFFAFGKITVPEQTEDGSRERRMGIDNILTPDFRLPSVVFNFSIPVTSEKTFPVLDHREKPTPSPSMCPVFFCLWQNYGPAGSNDQQSTERKALHGVDTVVGPRKILPHRRTARADRAEGNELIPVSRALRSHRVYSCHQPLFPSPRTPYAMLG